MKVGASSTLLMVKPSLLFKFNAANCALDTGLFASDILSTLPNPTYCFCYTIYCTTKA
jgi:hypothetical protein